jgi:hypothetical protein
MGRIEATSLADQRNIFAENPTAARGHFNIRHSITDWCLALVRSQDSARLPPASEALVSLGKTGWHFSGCVRTRMRSAR